MNSSALIVGDLQTGITGAHPFVRKIVPVVADLVDRARAADVLIVYVRVALRANGRDVHPENALISRLHAGSRDYHEGEAGVDLDPAFTVAEGDVVVTKRRGSAFAGTDLDLVLRAQGVRSLVVTGVATSAMVAATVYGGADLDYQLTVIRDACADPDPAVHDFFVDTVFPDRGVEVTTAKQWG